MSSKEYVATEISSRVSSFVDDRLKGNWAELARLTGLRPSTLQMLKEGSDSKFSTLSRISVATGISLDWLATGLGPMYKDQSEEMDARQDADRRVAALVAVLEQLAPEDRSRVLDDCFARAETAQQLSELRRAVAEMRHAKAC